MTVYDYHVRKFSLYLYTHSLLKIVYQVKQYNTVIIESVCRINNEMIENLTCSFVSQYLLYLHLLEYKMHILEGQKNEKHYYPNIQ